MVPSGPSTPVGGGPPPLIRSNSGISGTQSGSVPTLQPIGGHSLLRSNSGILGNQASSFQPQHPAFTSLMSQSQFNNMNLLGNMPNVSDLLNQSFENVNGGSTSGIPGSGSLQRSGIGIGADSDQLSGVADGMGLTPSVSFGSSMAGDPPCSSGQTPWLLFPNYQAIKCCLISCSSSILYSSTQLPMWTALVATNFCSK